jgi:hypothetical protein
MNGLAEPLPLAVQVPPVFVADPEKLQVTEPIGTGIELAVLDCHIRYIVALKDRLQLVPDVISANGASPTCWPISPAYGYC